MPSTKPLLLIDSPEAPPLVGIFLYPLHKKGRSRHGISWMETTAMTPTEREGLLREMDQTRENLLRAVEGLSREQLEYREAPDRWSVAEILEHIAFVEQGILGRVTEALRSSSAGSNAGGLAGDDVALRSALAESRKRGLQAPEAIRPKGRWPLEQLLPEFEASRRRTRDFVAAATGDLRGRSLPHAQFGALDCYQWLVLIASHCDRHRAQIEKVKASAGFPR